MPPRVKSIILISLPMVLAILASLIVQATVLSNPDLVAKWLSSFGPFLFLIYAMVQASTIIIAPIGGLFMLIALIAVIGPLKAMILFYLVSTPSFIVNFYIGRKYGRPLVEKIIGKAAMKTVDHYASDAGVVTIIIFKVFQGGIFDYLSYAIGLTKIPARVFHLVNILGGIPATIVSYYILISFKNFTTSIIVLIIAAYLFGGLAILINHLIKRHHLKVN